MTGRSGFSLIEALVALIVASLTLLAVFELQNQLASGQHRYEQALRIAALQRDAVTLTETLNPMTSPDGEREMGGGRTLRWSAEPLTDARQNTGYPSGLGHFRVRLYRLQVRVFDNRGRQLTEVSYDRVGWAPTGT